jgi:hypothetical protein
MVGCGGDLVLAIVGIAGHCVSFVSQPNDFPRRQPRVQADAFGSYSSSQIRRGFYRKPVSIFNFNLLVLCR